MNSTALNLTILDELNDTSTDNCTNDYCIDDKDYIVMIEDHLFPSAYEWGLISMHAVVFVVGLLGNAMVCTAVYRNHSMRTVTNYFIVNLALADFMVILFCLAPTVIWDVTETWFLGEKLCKIVLYIQVSLKELSQEGLRDETILESKTVAGQHSILLSKHNKRKVDAHRALRLEEYMHKICAMGINTYFT